MKRLLIVEDDDAFADILGRSMARRGYDVQRAADYTAACRLSAGTLPDYALVDLKLPGESGLRVVAHLASLHPQPRIVVLTGYASISTAVEAIKLGAVQYLAKPADVEAICAALVADAANPELDVQPVPMSVGRLEYEHIQKVLGENDGNVSATARALNMHRRTLQRKLAKRPPRL
jgi:two-component system response regulator RegA